MVFKDYRVTSEYGWRIHPIDGKRKFHAGIDLVKEHRAPIKAFVPGTVLYAGPGKPTTGVGGYGNVVIIEDYSGKAHVYAHLDSVSVQTGQVVGRNTVIGRQGATGQVTGSHLHYEIRKKSTPSYGWTSDQENSTHDPTEYVRTNEGGGKVAKKEKLKIDGYEGEKTIEQLQIALNMSVVDGKKSSPSNVVKQLQRLINVMNGFE